MIDTPLIRSIAGLDPEKLSTNVLRIYAGWCVDDQGNNLMRVPVHLDLDLTVVGKGGRDAGAPPSSGDQWFVYLLQNTSTGEVTGVLSRALFYGDVVRPAGFDAIRKLEFGFVYNANWDGIPNFHLSHWPKPLVRFTDAEYSGLWMPVAAGQAHAWTDVDCTKWIPDNARVGEFIFETRDAGQGIAASAYVRSYPGQSTGLLVGSSSPGISAMTAFPLRVDSARKFQYKVTPGAMLFVQCLGFHMTEPS